MADDREAAALDDVLADVQPSMLPVGADGGFVPAVENIVPDPIPAATPENMVCLRGPCVFYMEIVSGFAAGNAHGTLSRPPRQINRFCGRPNGEPISLVDEVVFECSEWYPRTEADDEDRTKARELYNIKSKKERK